MAYPVLQMLFLFNKKLISQKVNFEDQLNIMSVVWRHVHLISLSVAHFHVVQYVFPVFVVHIIDILIFTHCDLYIFTN